MPKKTKKEKILASQRRSLAPVSASRIDPARTVHSDSLSYSFQTPHQKKTEAVRVENAAELTVIKKDLVRTLTLAIIAIAAELVLNTFIHTK